MAYDYFEAVKSDCEERIEEMIENEELSIDVADYEADDFDSYKDDLQSSLYEDFFTDDSITGNASGSYFFNSAKSKEAVEENIDLLREALEEFGYNVEEKMEEYYEEIDYDNIEYDEDGYFVEEPEREISLGMAENADVTIRCYMLSEGLYTAMDSMEDKLQEYFEEKQAEIEQEQEQEVDVDLD